jgi:MoaA/NifB/PqqE/SkfB family radical SAM enzyme
MIEVLSLHFTDQCTRSCPGCYMRGKSGELKNPDFFMPFAGIARQLGIKQIALGGGEPTLFPNFVRSFAKACRENGVIVNMTTNGDGFNEKNMYYFKDLTLVSFSLDRHKVHSRVELHRLFEKMSLAHAVGLKVGANVQLDAFIIEHLYDMLGELFNYCQRVYLLQPKPNEVALDSGLRTKLLTASCLYNNLYADDSLLMALGLSSDCGRGRRIISVDYGGGVSACSFDQSFAMLKVPADLINIVEEHYPFQTTMTCPFLKPNDLFNPSE